MKTATVAGTLVLVSMIAACGGAGEPVTATVEPTTPAHVAAVGDTMVTGTVAATLEQQLRVIVTTASGKPVSGTVVTFTPGQGNGSVAASPVRTDASGVASATWTLGTTAGRQSLVASVSGLPSVTFAATVAGGSGTRIMKVSGDSQTAVVATVPSVPLAVRTLDAFDNPVSGVPVDIAVKSGGGTVATSRAISDQSGIAAFSGWSLGTKVGANEIEFTFGRGDPIRFVATAIAGPVDTVAFASTDTLWIVANDSTSPRLRAADRFGNVASVGGATLIADDEGIARANGPFVVGRAAGVTTIRARLGSASTVRVAAVKGHLGANARVTRIVKSAGTGAAISADRILSHAGDVSITVFDTQGTAIGGPMELPFLQPYVIGMTSMGSRKVFVTSEFDDFGVIVDLVTRTSTRVALEWPWSERPQRSLDGSSIYMLNYRWISRFDIAARRSAIEGPYRPSVLMYDFAQSDTLVLTSATDGQIDVLDARTLAVRRSLKLTEPARRIAIGRSGEFFYAANGKTLSVDVYRTGGEPIRVSSAYASSNPRAMMTSLDGLELYVINDLGELRIFSLADPAHPQFIRSLPLGAAFIDSELSFDDFGTTLLISGPGTFAIMR